MDNVIAYFQKTLPEKILNAYEEYNALVALAPDTDVKAIGAYQTACKSALAHVLSLLKLASLVQPKSVEAPPVSDWVLRAQTALQEEDAPFD